MLAKIVLAALLVHTGLTWVRRTRRAVAARHRAPPPATATDSRSLVSVLVPAWEELSVLERCITCLRALEYSHWEAVIIAGGQDGTYQRALELCAGDSRFQVIPQRPAGKNAALNDGFRLAKGAIIVLLDADSVVKPWWLHKLTGPLTEGLEAVGGNYMPLQDTWVSRWYQMEKIASYFIQGSTALDGAGAIAIKRELVERMGGFPEEVKVGVDWDLNARLEAMGVKKGFAPEAKVWTEMPTALGQFLATEVRWRRAHFDGLFRQSRLLGAGDRQVAQQFSFYLLSLGLIGGPVAAAALGGVVGSNWGAMTLKVWLMVLAWSALQRATLALEVAIFTGDRSWLRYLPVPPLFVLFSQLCSLAALASWWKRSAHFKGPRPSLEVR